MIYIDHLNRQIHIPSRPARIISLVPSITELLFDLGLGEQVVGVTRFCIFPATARKQKAIIGGTKNLKLGRILELKPDLIIADKEENTQNQIEELSKKHPVWISNIRKFDDALNLIREIGKITDTQQLAQKLTIDIQVAFAKIIPAKTKHSVAYFIWKQPLMVAGSDTFIHAMIQKAGFINCFEESSRYPTITEDQLRDAQPDIIFLSSEPYPFGKKHLSKFQAMMPNAIIVLVDGTFFSWYGSRMLKAAIYFTQVRNDVKRINP